MAKTPERQYISDAVSWDTFVGNITPNEFMVGYDSASSAISDYMLDWVFYEQSPAWLELSLLNYLESKGFPL